MGPTDIPSRPRILSSSAHKYIGKQVCVIGELTTINTTANTLMLRMPDDDTMIALLTARNTTPVEPHLLTEVSGKLVSRGQIEATIIKQYSPKETQLFNRSFYVEAMNVLEGLRHAYES